MRTSNNVCGCLCEGDGGVGGGVFIFTLRWISADEGYFQGVKSKRQERGGQRCNCEYSGGGNEGLNQNMNMKYEYNDSDDGDSGRDYDYDSNDFLFLGTT